MIIIADDILNTVSCVMWLFNKLKHPIVFINLLNINNHVPISLAHLVRYNIYYIYGLRFEPWIPH